MVGAYDTNGRHMVAKAGTRNWSPDEAVGAIRNRWRGNKAILGTGSWHQDGCSRVGLLQVDGVERPKLIWDGYVKDGEVEDLRRRLSTVGAVMPGALDFMYATEWRVAWTTTPAPFAVYDRKGLCASVVDRNLIARSRSGVQRIIPAKEVRAVIPEGRAFRARSRVLVRTASGEDVSLVAVWDLGAWFDDVPYSIYESWTVSVANILSERLGLSTPSAV